MPVDSLHRYKDQTVALAMDWVPKLMLAAFTLIVGIWLIGGAVRLFKAALARRDFDTTLTPFLVNLLGSRGSGAHRGRVESRR